MTQPSNLYACTLALDGVCAVGRVDDVIFGCCLAVATWVSEQFLRLHTDYDVALNAI